MIFMYKFKKTLKMAVLGCLLMGYFYSVLALESNFSTFIQSASEDTIQANTTTKFKDKSQRKITFQSGTNYYDHKNRLFKKKDLNFRSINHDKKNSDLSKYNYRVENDLKMLFSETMKKTRVESPAGDFVEFELVRGEDHLGQPKTSVANKISASHNFVETAKPTLVADHTGKRKAKVKKVKGSADLEVVPTDRGYKETIILADRTAPVRYDWLYSSNLGIGMSLESNAFLKVITFGEEFVSRIFAVDSTGRNLPVNVSFTWDTLSVEVDTVGAVFPVVLDPSVEWQHAPDFGKDIELNEYASTTNYGANVYSAIKSYDHPTNGLSDAHKVIQFDSLGYIPSYSIIDSARLILTHYYANTNLSFDSTMSVFRVTQLWTEGESSGGMASWDSASTAEDNGGSVDSLWTTPGGTIDTTKYGTRTIPETTAHDTVSFDVTDLVQGWVDGSFPNYGMLLKWHEVHASTNLTIYASASDCDSVSWRPKLEVFYTEPPIIIKSTSDIHSYKFDVNLSIIKEGNPAFDSLFVHISTVIDTTGLAAYYSFNADATDQSGKSNDGINNGATHVTDLGDFHNGGGAYDFDGNDFINIDSVYVNELASTTQGTWDVWLKPDDATPAIDSYIITLGDTDAESRMSLYLNPDGILCMWIIENGFWGWALHTDAAPLLDSTWTYIALVQDGISPNLYIDGVAVAQTFPVSVDNTLWINDLPGLDNGRIGCINFNNSGNFVFWNGLIDEVRLHSRVLSAQEIEIYYNQTKALHRSDATTDSLLSTYNDLLYSTEYEYMIFGYNGDSLETISNTDTVRTFDPAFAPYELAKVSLNSTEIGLRAVDSSAAGSVKAVFKTADGTIAGDTVTLGTSFPETFSDTVTIPTYCDSLLFFQAVIVDTLGNTYISPDTLEVYTLAHNVISVTAADTSDSTVQFVFPDDSNHSGIYYRTFDGNSGKYITPAGDSLTADTSWYIKADFDTLDLSTTPNELFKLYVEARNSDSISTGLMLNDSVWSWAKISELEEAYKVSKDSIYIQIDPQDNPDYTYFAIQDSISGKFLDINNHEFRSVIVTVDSSWAWGTYAEWGSTGGYYIFATPGTKYILRVYTKEGNKKDK